MDVQDVELSTGLRMQVAESGRGGRPLLLVHGFTGAKEDFTDWLDPLPELGWDAVAVDKRGHGGGEKPSSKDEYSFDVLAADALALADGRWGSGSHFTLLGHSMGGMVAQVGAMRAADRLQPLGLMGPGAGPRS